MNVVLFLWLAVFSLEVSDPAGSYEGGFNDDVVFPKGEYVLDVYGAQGGDSYKGGSLCANGGKGARVSATIHFDTETTLTFKVGKKGSSGKTGPNAGGWPDGGDSGKDTGASNGLFGPSNIDGSGGGGGSSQVLKGSTKWIVAAGGSGAAYEMDGCYGGPKGYVVCASGMNIYYEISQSQMGKYNSNGGTGVDHDNIPGSGGGGGYYSGVSSGSGAITNDYKAIACSGSSYYSTSYLKSPKNYTKSRENDGLIKVTTKYICQSKCKTCSSAETCDSCEGERSYYDGDCILVCPDGTTSISNKCQQCLGDCAACADGNQYKCTRCKNDKFLCEEDCCDECPGGTYVDRDNMMCVPCNSSCKFCSDKITCTTCHSNYILIDGKCLLDCPSHYYKDGDECFECSPNCAECSETKDTCTVCGEGKILYKTKCYDIYKIGTYQSSFHINRFNLRIMY